MKKLFLVVFLCVAFLFIANTASAVPSLQLDIVGGIYDGNTTITSSPTFELWALSDTNIGTYYISAALVPKTSGPDPVLSPTINGFSVSGGVDIDYGLSSAMWGDPGLEHGIFDTTYYEYKFTFDDVKIANYNVATDLPGPGEIYQARFAIDVSDLLDAGYYVHFDLYDKALNNQGPFGVIEANNFAPFSKDAAAVPEPATLLLLGGGLVGLAGFGRKKFKK